MKIQTIPTEKKLNPQSCTFSGNKIAAIANYCFQSIKSILTFPFRFLGSKTWSIPGAIIRTPWIVFKRIFLNSPVSIKEELFGDKYHYFFEKELTPFELKPYLPYAYSVQFVATMKPEDICPGWSHVSSREIAPESDAASPNGSFVDPATGFQAVVMKREKEVMVCFGALGVVPGIQNNTAKWKRPVLLTKALITNNPPAARQIAKSLLGLTPPVYERAEEFVQNLKSLPQFENHNFTVTGLCYGGSIASYVGIKQGLKTISFNSFPLSMGAQQNLSQEELNRAEEYVTHISAKGDYLTHSTIGPYIDTALSRIGIRTPGHFGRRFLIPSAYTTSSKTHGFILGSVLAHIQKDLPNETHKTCI